MSSRAAAQLTYAAWGPLTRVQQAAVVGVACAVGAAIPEHRPLQSAWLLALLTGLLLTTSA